MIGRISNPLKIRVLEALRKRKRMSLELLSKHVRIPEFTLRDLLEELKKDGFVDESEGYIVLTDYGIKALKEIYDFRI